MTHEMGWVDRQRTSAKKKRLTTVAGVLVLVLVLPSVVGQDVSGIAMPTLRVESQLVVLDLVVTDRAGNIVTNLTRDGFVVYEDGVEQTIKTFETPQEKPVLPTVPPKDRNGHDDWGESPRTILVIDALNTPFAEIAYCRDQVERYLRAQPPLLAQPTIALWLNDRGFHPISSFTRNREALILAIDHHSASIPDNLTRGDLLKMFNESLAALQQIALFGRGQKGSKQIVWVGRSFPTIDGSGLSSSLLDAFHRAVRSTINELLESRTTVYVIDPTVQTGPPDQAGTDAGDVSLKPAIAEMPDAINAIAQKESDPFELSFDFKRLVTQSGGEYFQNRNDLNHEIGESIAKATTFYSLSYVPSKPIETVDYRKIDVRTRDAKYVVHTRQGYYPSLPLQKPVSSRELRFDLFEAMVTGMEYASVGVRIDGCKVRQDRSETICDVLVDNETLSPVAEAEDFARGEVTTVIAALDSRYVPLANRVSQLLLILPHADMETKNFGTTRLQLHLAIPPGTKSIRIVVRDVSGRIGTADVNPQQIQALITRKR